MQTVLIMKGRLLLEFIFCMIVPLSVCSQNKDNVMLDPLSAQLRRIYGVDPDSSLRIAQKGREIAAKQGEKEKLARFNFHIGVLYFRKGNFELAERYTLEARRYYDSVGDVRVSARINAALSAYMFSRGNPGESKAYAWLALPYARSGKDPVLSAELFYNLGRAHFGNQFYDSAQYYLQEGIQWSKSDSSNHYRISTLMERAREMQGKKGVAVQPLKMAIDYARSAGDMDLLWTMYIDLGSSYQHSGLYDQAINAFDSGWAIRRRSFLGVDDDAALKMRAGLLKAKGDYAGAIRAYESYISVSDSVENAKSKALVDELLVKYEVELKQKEIEVLSKEKEIQDARLRQQRILLVSLLFLAGLVILSVLLFYRFRIKAVRLAAERVSLEMKLFSLRSQINPHFVQNTFNFIKLLLAGEQNPGLASSYVRQLSGYYRNVLDITAKNQHALEEELNFTESYLKLQQSMMPGHLEYQFDVKQDLDLTSIRVPTMLLQPFVENSIKHGFGLDRKQNRIHIEVACDENGPMVRITDNGKGLGSMDPVHEGFGTRLMRQRLEMLGGRPGENVLSIRPSNSASGTVVEIKLSRAV
jgi:tetratricopeptide (TPR) repeat protein